MLAPGSKVKVARVSVSHIVVSERGPLDRERVAFYVDKLVSAPEHALSPVHLAPFTPTSGDDIGTKAPDAHMWQLLDGRHRFVAALLAGRTHVPALLFSEPDWPCYPTRTSDDGWVQL